MNRKQSHIGSYPIDWDLVVFDSVAELKHGYQFRTYDFTKNGVKVFKITQIKDDGTIDISKCDYIDDSRIDQFQKFVIRNGDILMALSGATIGKIARFKSDEITLQNYRVGNFLPLDEKVLAKNYFFYFLSSEYTYQQILSNLTQSAQENVGKEDIHKMYIFLPPLPEQIAISEILTSLDEKIDLLHRQNKTLEQLAETLFRQWFIEEAEEGWEEGKLGDLINVKYGKDHKNLQEGKIPAFGSGGIMRYVDKALYEKESVLIPRKGTLSNVMYIDEPFWTVDTMFYTEMKKPNIAKFIFHYIKGLDLASMNVGSAVPSMTTEVLNSMKMIIPSVDRFAKFEISIGPIYKKIKTNNTQIKTLTLLRDTLLPKLMSGEIRVGNFQC